MVEAVFDTNILVDYLRGFAGAKPLLEKVKSGEISGYISVVTEAELVSGADAEDPGRRGDFWDVIGRFSLMGVDEELARSAGEIRRKYGTNLIDAMIAATAINLRCKLLTQNIKDFANIAEITAEKPY